MRTVKSVARAISALVGWAPQGRITARTLMAALIGVSAPILLGLAIGRLQLGLTIGLGALFLSGGAATGAIHRWRAAGAALIVTLVSVAAALLIVSGPAPELALVGLAFIAALFSGFSRAVGQVAIRAIIYTVLCVTLLESRASHWDVAAMIFVSGAGWNILVRTALAEPVAAGVDAPSRKPTSRQLWANGRRGLSTFAGWQFPLRLAGGLSIACALRDVWQERHFSWIILTTALLTERPLERFPLKILQRMVGTAAGLGLAFLLLSERLEAEATMALVAALVALAALARLRSYLLYACCSTPVILLAMDFGKAFDLQLLIDRLAATVVAALIVLAGNQIMGSVVPSASPKSSKA